jgi:hypothetical protein
VVVVVVVVVVEGGRRRKRRRSTRMCSGSSGTRMCSGSGSEVVANSHRHWAPSYYTYLGSPCRLACAPTSSRNLASS